MNGYVIKLVSFDWFILQVWTWMLCIHLQKTEDKYQFQCRFAGYWLALSNDFAWSQNRLRWHFERLDSKSA